MTNLLNFMTKTKKKAIFHKIYGLFLFIAQKIKNPRVIKYHQKKALFVWKKGRNFYLGTVLHDWVIVIQSVRALKAKNWSGQEGV